MFTSKSVEKMNSEIQKRTADNAQKLAKINSLLETDHKRIKDAAERMDKATESMDEVAYSKAKRDHEAASDALEMHNKNIESLSNEVFTKEEYIKYRTTFNSEYEAFERSNMKEAMKHIDALQKLYDECVEAAKYFTNAQFDLEGKGRHDKDILNADGKPNYDFIERYGCRTFEDMIGDINKSRFFGECHRSENRG